MSTVRSIRRGKLLTTRQAAAYMGVGESAIRVFLRGVEGDALPYIKSLAIATLYLQRSC